MLQTCVDSIYDNLVDEYAKFKGDKYPDYEYETGFAAKKHSRKTTNLDMESSELAIAEYNSLNELEKNIAHTIFRLIHDKENLLDYFVIRGAGNMTVKSNAPEFLDILKMLYLLTHDLVKTNSPKEFTAKIKNLSSKMEEAKKDEDFFKNRDELPLKKEILGLSKLIKTIVPEIKEGMKESIQNILDDIVENTNDYSGLTRTVVEGTGSDRKKVQTEMKILERLKELGLIEDE